MLIQPICASTATEPVNRERVGVILKEARLRNELRVLTGTLVFDPQCVLQVVQGERQSVKQLFGRLVTDRRHSNLTLISCAKIQNRSHAACAMGFASASQANKAALLRHGTTSRFDPCGLSTAATLAPISELSDIATSVAAP